MGATRQEFPAAMRVYRQVGLRAPGFLPERGSIDRWALRPRDSQRDAVLIRTGLWQGTLLTGARHADHAPSAVRTILGCTLPFHPGPKSNRRRLNYPPVGPDWWRRRWRTSLPLAPAPRPAPRALAAFLASRRRISIALPRRKTLRSSTCPGRAARPRQSEYEPPGSGLDGVCR